MAKRRVKKVTKKGDLERQWSPERRKRTVGVLFQSMRENHLKTVGRDDIWVCSKDARLSVGLPMPGLCLEWLIDNMVLPLPHLLQIVGRYGTCKSSLLFETMRWFVQSGGGGVLVENETKFSESLFLSMLNYDDSSVVVRRSHTVEDWQNTSLFVVNDLKARCTGSPKQPGPGRVVPLVVGVDSVVGKLAQASVEGIKKAGHAERSHPLEALLISRFVPMLMSEMSGWPFLYVIVNQLNYKQAQDGTGRMERSKGGGNKLDFQASIELEMKKLSPIRQTRKRGNQLSITCHKNSLGEDGRTIFVDMVWGKKKGNWTDPATGQEVVGVRQHTYWDWAASTVNLLLSMSRDSRKFAANLHDIVDLNHKDMAYNQKGLWSKKLGRSSPKDAADYTTIGRAIQSDRALVRTLRELLGIGPGSVFDPSTDFAEQLRRVSDRTLALENERIEKEVAAASKGGALSKTRASQMRLKEMEE